MSVNTPWSHSICEGCWTVRHGGRTPYRVIEEHPQRCCYCGEEHRSGIYVRGDPRTTPCGGNHPGPEKEPA